MDPAGLAESMDGGFGVEPILPELVPAGLQLEPLRLHDQM
jgi:hypothetical protein